MHISEIFQEHQTTFSFEFFPPKTEKESVHLYSSIQELESLRPSFVSVTYGAGGTSRERTHDLVVRLKETSTCDPVPHLTSVCHQEPEIREILERYAAHGISNIHALGGDPPRHMPDYDRSHDAFRYAADLVRFIKEFNGSGVHPHPLGFGIGVAGYPEGHPATPNRMLEMDYLKEKIDAGADYIVTQMFFDNRDFYDFRERCELAGIRVPILAGIMPITSSKGMARMAQLALCTRYPARLLRSIARCGGDESYVRRVGIHWATEQCRDLLDNRVRGVHFYTLNHSTATREIFAALGGKDARGLQG
jgi:5,10-methylenetetrahydrofolate reductase, prokaryotic form